MRNVSRLLILLSIFFSLFSTVAFAKVGKLASSGEKKTESEGKSSHFFRPLLIQGRKQFSKKSKDLKVDGENIVESEVLSIKVNFKDRIFELESM